MSLNSYTIQNKRCYRQFPKTNQICVLQNILPTCASRNYIRNNNTDDTGSMVHTSTSQTSCPLSLITSQTSFSCPHNQSNRFSSIPYQSFLSLSPFSAICISFRPYEASLMSLMQKSLKPVEVTMFLSLGEHSSSDE